MGKLLKVLLLDRFAGKRRETSHCCQPILDGCSMDCQREIKACAGRSRGSCLQRGSFAANVIWQPELGRTKPVSSDESG